MRNLTYSEATDFLSVTLTAMVFNIMLCILVKVLGSNKDRKSRGFQRLALVVLLGSALTCAAVYTRMVMDDHVPPYVGLFTHLCSIGANILLSYYFARYVESFFGDNVQTELGRKIEKIHRYVTVCSAISVLICFFIMLPNVDSTEESITIPTAYRFIVGYGIELYFLIFALAYFIRFKAQLDSRSFRTLVAGFIVTVGGIIFESLKILNVACNYPGAVIGLYLFYFGAETADYKKLADLMQELKVAKEKADAANIAKSEFLANMSHEIRTPINAVLGMNEMIIRECSDPNIVRYARDVEGAGKNLLAIINDILDFSKIEAGKMELVEAPYRLSAVLNDVVNMTIFRVRSKNLKFDVKVDKDIPDNLSGDEVRIRRIIVNLLNNAVKYTEKGTVSLEVRQSRNNDNFDLIVDVTDTGIGIKSEEMPRLFNRFDRLDLSQTKTIEGTGLGLAITKGLLNLMGGSINVVSMYGKGSTFTATIPQKIVDSEPIGNWQEKYQDTLKEKEEYKEDFHAPDARILVVDDTIINLIVVQNLLKQSQMTIDTASSGQEMLDMTVDTKYDVILLDQRMPQMDGTEALHLLRERENDINADTPVICLTADAISGAKERYISEGFTDYLTKPIEGSELEEMLMKYLPAEKLQV
ncbi:MAG: response regulator [Lachnospiraceae bacterium]|nr:response regulator [Lachnospiraceae bacterium]